MKAIIQQARKKKELTQQRVAKQMFLTLRQYQRLEYGEQEMTPEQAVSLAKVLQCQAVTMHYCRKRCAIGRRYCYEILNNVDLSPQNILIKLYLVHREAGEALGRMMGTIVNKQHSEDFTEAEKRSFKLDFHDLLDLEHTIEMLKIELDRRQWLNIPILIGEHNSKCYRHGYVVSDSVKEEPYEYGKSTSTINSYLCRKAG